MPVETMTVARAVRMLWKMRELDGDKGPWDLAVYPRTGTTHLVVDGWLSVGDDSHLAARYSSSVEKLDPLWSPRVRAFSYNIEDPSLQYDGDDTLGFARVYAANLSRMLDAHSSKWVLTSYSIGAAVTLLALARLLQDNPRLRTKIPLVILLEPAIHGAPGIVDYVLHGEGQSKFSPTPYLLFDLGEADGHLPRRARQAIIDLLDAGVEVAVVYSSHDKMASYHRVSDPRISHFEIPSQELKEKRTGEVDPIRVHFRMRDRLAPHRLIYSLTKPSVVLHKR